MPSLAGIFPTAVACRWQTVAVHRSLFPGPLAAQIPSGPLPVPRRVRELSFGDSIEPVWVNQLGGITFRMGAGTPRERFVKWVSAGTSELDLHAESLRLQWAVKYAAVPEVLAYGMDESGEWLVTRAIEGFSAVTPENIDRPAVAAHSIGEGLRALHDALPVADCPFSWSLDLRLAAVHARLERGDGPKDRSPEFQGLTIEQALADLAELSEPEEAVVCHGDPCAPNTLLTEAGAFAAHIDLDSLGVADRMADIAVAAWSTVWNYGPGFEDEVYAGYGIVPDPDVVRRYRLLWDLS